MNIWQCYDDFLHKENNTSSFPFSSRSLAYPNYASFLLVFVWKSQFSGFHGSSWDSCTPQTFRCVSRNTSIPYLFIIKNILFRYCPMSSHWMLLAILYVGFRTSMAWLWYPVKILIGHFLTDVNTWVSKCFATKQPPTRRWGSKSRSRPTII